MTPEPINTTVFWIINITTICTAIGTIFAGIAAYRAAKAAKGSLDHAKIEWEQQKMFNAPFIIVEAPGIKATEQSPPYEIRITFVNSGHRPAHDLYGKIYLMTRELENKPLYEIDFSLANAVPPKWPNPWYTDIRLSENVPPLYIVVAIRYKDPPAGTTSNDFIYMKWDGVVKGKFRANFVHAAYQEKQKIMKYLNKNCLLQDFT